MVQFFTEIFQTYIVQAGLFLIMWGLGLTLSIDDLAKAIVRPKALLVGLTGQMVLLPLLAFFLAFVFRSEPVITIGLILLAACPGGITSNAYTLVSRGDVALSVSLTTLSSIMTVVTMPLLAYVAFQTFGSANSGVDVPMSTMIVSLARLTVLPIVLGMLLRWRFPALAERLTEPVRKMALVILIGVIVGNTVTSFDVLMANIVDVGLLAGTLNLSALAMGFGLAKLFRLPNEQTVSLTFEVGVQNLSLVLTLAMAILHIPEYAAFALVYSLFMKITSLGFTAYSLKYLTARTEDLTHVKVGLSEA
jgi:BASS family bile acid:Na+ symporter